MSGRDGKFTPASESMGGVEAEKRNRGIGTRKSGDTRVLVGDATEANSFVETSEMDTKVDQVLKHVELELGLETVRILRDRYERAISRGMFAIRHRETADPTHSRPSSERSSLYTEAFAALKYAIADALEKIRSTNREDRLIPELKTRQQATERFNDLVAQLRENEQLVFVSMDLDDFKKINDTLGHVMGDQVLRSFGTALYSAVRPDDVSVHFSGDEFGLMLKTDIKKQDGQEVDVSEVLARIVKYCQDTTVRPIVSNDGVSEIQKISTGFVKIPFEKKEKSNFEMSREKSDRASEFSKLLDILLELRGGGVVDSDIRVVDYAAMDMIRKQFSDHEINIARYVRGMRREFGEFMRSGNAEFEYSIREMAQIAELILTGKMKEILNLQGKKTE